MEGVPYEQQCAHAHTPPRVIWDKGPESIAIKYSINY